MKPRSETLPMATLDSAVVGRMPPQPVAKDEAAHAAIEVHQLFKHYGAHQAVAGISFQVETSEIVGILGPNGAGKTTTLELLEGLRDPDPHPHTRLRVLGLDPRVPGQRRELHQRIGLQLQAGSLFDELTVDENLRLLTALYRTVQPIAQLLAQYDLTAKAHARLETLSGGQKQRVALAAALVNDPALVFLDEPTTALDPQARRSVWDAVRQWQHDGKTVVLTTHSMEEAEALCDRVAIMDNGAIIVLDTPARLIRQYAPIQAVFCQFTLASRARVAHDWLEQIPAVMQVTAHHDGYLLHTQQLTATMTSLVQQAQHRQVELAEMTMRQPSLEDVFLALTGKVLRD